MSSVKRILVTGGDGQLAQALQQTLLNQQTVFCSKNELDIASEDQINQFFLKYRPEWVINTAAYTQVDAAEAHPQLALQVNYRGAKQLAIACARSHIPLLHLSTDYLFDGETKAPYKENDKPKPVNQYGLSKWLGEAAIRSRLKQHLILRVSGIFSQYKTNFVKTIFKLSQTQNRLEIVSDQLSCPTAAYDIAMAILQLINASVTRWGTYHFCSTPPISWYEFAQAVMSYVPSHQVTEIKAISTKDYASLAKRPAYSALDCSKIKSHYGIEQPCWQKALEQVMGTLPFVPSGY